MMNFQISRGVIFSLLATLSFSFMAVFTKYLSAALPLSQIIFFRGIVCLIILIFIMKLNNHSFRPNNLPLLVLRGTLGVLGLFGIYYTIAHIKLGDANILFKLSPVFVVLFARVFLKESILKIFYPVFFLSIIGCLLVIKPNFANVNNTAGVIGVLAAASAAAAYTCVRKLTRDHNKYIIILSFVLMSLIVSGPIMIPNFIKPSALQMAALVMVGVTSMFGQIFLTTAYKHERAGVVSMIGYVGILLHVLWGYLFWNEMLDIYSIIGGALIIVSCTTLAIAKSLSKSKN